MITHTLCIQQDSLNTQQESYIFYQKLEKEQVAYEMTLQMVLMSAESHIYWGPAFLSRPNFYDFQEIKPFFIHRANSPYKNLKQTFILY